MRNNNSRKCQKYAELSAAYECEPVSVETQGPLSVSTVSFLVDLDRKISERTGEPWRICSIALRTGEIISRGTASVCSHIDNIETDF